jgi:hypothetical protein
MAIFPGYIQNGFWFPSVGFVRMNRWEILYTDIRMGLEAKYPLCCLIQFTVRHVIGGPDSNPAVAWLNRNTARGRHDDRDYVPCFFCENN